MDLKRPPAIHLFESLIQLYIRINKIRYFAYNSKSIKSKSIEDSNLCDTSFLLVMDVAVQHSTQQRLLAALQCFRHAAFWRGCCQEVRASVGSRWVCLKMGYTHAGYILGNIFGKYLRWLRTTNLNPSLGVDMDLGRVNPRFMNGVIYIISSVVYHYQFYIPL